MAKVMLVEDDNNLREIYEARLQAEGYQIVSAKDGEEALVLAKAEKPDLIISDVMMPKISGFEMLDILRNTEGLKQVKVIMLTALGQNDDQKLATRLGTDRYLVKSQVTLEDIVKVAHELLADDQASTPPADPAGPVADATPAPSSVPPPADPPTPAPSPVPEPAPQPATPPAGPPSPDPMPPADPPVTPPPAQSTETENPASAAPAVADAGEPAAPAEPPIADSSAAAAAGDDAQSTLQEEASVDGKIEDFVAGATEDPMPNAPPSDNEAAITEPAITPVTSTPETASVTRPATPPDPAATVPSPETTKANTASDDKLVAEAAQKLVDSTGTATPDASSTDEAKPATSASEDEDRRTKKIIKPIDTGPKKDLDTLLALEEAKEASTTPAPTATPIVVSDSGEHPASPPENPVIEPTVNEDAPAGTPASSAKPVVTAPADPGDPNNIAL